MEDLKNLLAILKEAGGLALLGLVIFWGVPKLAAAMDRNTRMIYHLGNKLGIEINAGSDILKEMEGK